MGRKQLIPVDFEILTADPAAPPSGFMREYWHDGWRVAEDSSGARQYLNCKKKRLSGSDVTNTTTTPATVSGLSFGVEDAAQYYARWSGVYVTGATTTGIRMGINYTSGTSLVWQFLGDAQAGTSQVGGASGATDTHNQASGSGPAGTFQPFWMEAELDSTAAQTLEFRVWSEVGGSAATIKVRAIGQLWRLDD